MNHLSRLTLAAVAVALTPQIARAEGPPLSSVQVYCQPGSLNNCFAFAITSADGHLTYWLQNLQGSVEPGGTAFRLQRFTIHNIAVDPSTESVFFIHPNNPDGRSFEGNVLPGREAFFQDNSVTQFNRTYAVGSGPGIIGCINPVPPPTNVVDLVAQTCLPTGLDGFVRFDANAFITQVVGGVATTRLADQEDFYFNVAGCAVYVGSRSGFTSAAGTNCSTNINYADLRASFTTVPEPSSIALLGSGLTGMGLFGRRRRVRGRVE